MKRKAKIAIIVEGAKTEPQIFNSINELFFSQYDIVSFVLPTCTNIYGVWKYVKDDEVDIIEAIKELIAKQNTLKHKDRLLSKLGEYRRNDFSEIYLFYDLDAHHNLRHTERNEVGMDILSLMFAYFDNETEHGKLYISYPMVEAIKHFFSLKHCDNGTCFYPINDGKQFKKFVSNNTCINDFKKLDLNLK